MPHLEWWRVIHAPYLISDGIHDALVAVPRIHAPESCRPVENLATVWRAIVHPLCFGEQSRRTLERAIRREWHPERVE